MKQNNDEILNQVNKLMALIINLTAQKLYAEAALLADNLSEKLHILNGEYIDENG